MGDARGGTVLVIDRWALLGVVEPEDVARYLRRADAGGPAPPSSGRVPPRPDFR